MFKGGVEGGREGRGYPDAGVGRGVQCRGLG
jgi:hypothetical protein